RVLYMQEMKLFGVGPGDEQPPVPLVAAIAGAQDSILEAAIGKLNRIFVVVPLEGKFEIAQGGVFSYYEFRQPRSDRLTDQAWQAMLGDSPPKPPAWQDSFSLPAGSPSDVLAFRIGDIYLITQAGDNLNVRQLPSRNAQILGKFRTGNYVEIIDGPRQADGFTWWKIQLAEGSQPLTGWAVEQQGWYERAWGQ
ncbi:MAG: DUF3160 domain-containing protein, partial [Acidobacteriaceae bacterium]